KLPPNRELTDYSFMFLTGKGMPPMQTSLSTWIRNSSTAIESTASPSALVYNWAGVFFAHQKSTISVAVLGAFSKKMQPGDPVFLNMEGPEGTAECDWRRCTWSGPAADWAAGRQSSIDAVTVLLETPKACLPRSKKIR